MDLCQVRSDVEKIAQREIDSLNIEVFKNLKRRKNDGTPTRYIMKFM